MAALVAATASAVYPVVTGSLVNGLVPFACLIGIGAMLAGLVAIWEDGLALGPAAIALAQRYNLDSRDAGRAQREQIIQSNEGVWECTLVGECSEVCPKNVDPAGAIQGAKLEGALHWWTGGLLPGQK